MIFANDLGPGDVGVPAAPATDWVDWSIGRLVDWTDYVSDLSGGGPALGQGQGQGQGEGEGEGVGVGVGVGKRDGEPACVGCRRTRRVGVGVAVSPGVVGRRAPPGAAWVWR